MYRKECIAGYYLLLTIYSVRCENATLFKHLFHWYEKDVFPRCPDEMVTVNISVDIALRQIVDINEPEQSIAASLWMRLTWNDCSLLWDLDQWGRNLSSITVTSDRLWIPDITLYENLDKPIHKPQGYSARIYSDGMVTYNFPMHMHTTCKIDVNYFPFDRQSCELTFGSWVHPIEEIDLHSKADSGDRDSYIGNGEWDLIDLPTSRSVSEFGELGQFALIKFNITLKRRSLYYVFNIIFPSMLVSLTAMLCFCLPPASGEKVSLAVTVVLTETVFLLLLSEITPTTSEVIPLMGRYFAVVLSVISLSTMMTVIVLNVHYRGGYGRGVPRLAKKIFLNRFMIKLFHPGRYDDIHNAEQSSNMRSEFTRTATEFTRQSYPPVSERSLTRQLPSSIRRKNRSFSVRVHRPTNEQITPDFRRLDTIAEKKNMTASNGHIEASTLELVKEQGSILKNVEKNFADEDARRKVYQEWEDVATVLDRIFLVICLTALLVTAFAFFMSM